MDFELETESAAALVGSIVADRYRIDELLGRGAMGAVYRAFHVHMQKAVALKVLHRETSANPEVVKRFEREAIAAGRVVHPRVATAQDFGQLKDGSFYLVLEYVDGRSLRDVLESGSLEPGRAAGIAGQVAEALAAAHQAGIVHRDLKPENVMLVGDASEEDRVKVLDFGLAKLGQEDSTDTKLTKMGAVYGTPQYMSPEQASGSEVDHRADLYALGVMLYEMLAGHPPFQADQMVALLVKHMTEEPPPLPESVPEPLRDLALALLAKDPAARPQSAEEVVLHLFGEQPSARVSLASFGPRSPAISRAPSLAGASTAPVVSSSSTDGSLVDRARDKARPVVEFLRAPLPVRGTAFPRWVWALGASVLVSLVVVGFASLSGPTEEVGGVIVSERKEAGRSDKPVDPELARVLDAARQGSDSALYALEQRKDDERSSNEWMALAQARVMRKDVEKALGAYRAALEIDELWAEDKTMLGALRQLAGDEKYSKPIFEFAATSLGSIGADLLFDVWSKTSLKTPETILAWEYLSKSSTKKSDALQIALDLREVDECEDYLDLLPRVERVGDDRTLVRLRELEKTRGCGTSNRDDCYPCLRKDDSLKKAMSAAGMRASRRFEIARRFRFK